MKQLIALNLILIFFASCSGQDKKENYNQKAIELNNKAVELMANMQYDSAIILLDKAIEIDESYYLPHSNKCDIYLYKKEFDKALNESKIVIKIKPDLAEGWAFTGMLYDRLGDTIKAKEYYKKSIELFDDRIANPDKKEKIFANKLNRSISLILIGREKEGKDELKKIKIEYPGNPGIDEYLKMSKQEYLNKIFE